MTERIALNSTTLTIVSQADIRRLLTPPCVRRTGQRYMGLDKVPVSDAAQALVQRLSFDLARVIDRRPLMAFQRAVGAILGDLMTAAGRDPETRSYRSSRPESFTGQQVGFRPFTDGMRAMVATGLVWKSPGFFKANGRGEAAQYRATLSLLNQANVFGVRPDNRQEHFASIGRMGFIPNAIVLRAKRRSYDGDVRGANLLVDWLHPKVAEAKRQVDGINAYFENVDVAGAEHKGFKRVFGAGDDPAFDWDMGGRLYSLGDGYQAIKSAERRLILLNGEPTLEVDIKGSHLTIVHALLGIRNDKPDPYAVEGLPRSIVKSWVTMALGYGKLQQRWSEKARSDYARDHDGASLAADYPLMDIRPTLIDALPEVSLALANGIGWAKLQYLESCAVIDAVDQLAYRHDIPALPVHDSLIVPVSKLETTKAVLSACFEQHVGVQPRLEVKSYNTMA